IGIRANGYRELVRSRLVSDSTSRDVEWEQIEEERLEEPKEGWMLGESKKRSTQISSRMLIERLVPRSRVTLVKAKSNPSEAHHKFISSVIATHRSYRCLRFMGKRTTVNARSRRSTKVDESKLCDIPVVCEFLKVFSKDLIGGARIAFEDEFGAAEEREVSCEAQQGRRGVKRKLFRSYRNNMGNEPILALPKGSENFIVMRGERVRMLA
ncbi:hypothetical protein Tco_0882899, partial [Tanacetum coccineum]